MVNGKKTFVTITNQQIYSELENLKEQNGKEHQMIMAEVSRYKSQVMNFKLALGGIGVLALSTLGWLFIHINHA
jgi:hypothetical protein